MYFDHSSSLSITVLVLVLVVSHTFLKLYSTTTMRVSMVMFAASCLARPRVSLAFMPYSIGRRISCHGHGLRLLSSSALGLNQNDVDLDVDITTTSSKSTSKTSPSFTPSTLPSTKSIKGVIFDMDGTLIKPCIDFAEMRRRIYDIADTDPLLQDKSEVERRGDVLHLYTTFSEKGQVAAKAVFDDIEAKALRDMMLMPSIGDLCNFLDGKGIPRAVLTRNVGKSIEVMQEKLWESKSVKEFFPVVNRESEGSDGRTLEMKPSPDAIFHICNVWGCDPKDVLMVGDSAADDIVAANRAGCGGSVLLNFNGLQLDNDSGDGDARSEEEIRERIPTIVIHGLEELQEILEAN